MNYIQNKFNLDVYIMNEKLSNKEKMNLFLSGVIGIIVGLITSVLVNITLTEISVNPFFTIYFGVIFIVLGVIIIKSV